MGVAASSASAKDVWLWACHGPSGQPIATTVKTGSNAGDAQAAVWNNGCASDASANNAGYKLNFSKATPADASSASVTIELPSGLNAKAVKINRTLRGFDGTTGVSYRALAGSTEVDSSAAPKTGEVAVTPGAGSITFNLSCSSSCAGSPEVELVSVALLVSDETAPSGGVNWNTPVDKEMVVTPAFTDSGVGLDRAEITIAGVPGVRKTVYFNQNKCAELSPTNATNDRPLDPAACLNGREQSGHSATNPLPLLPVPAEIVLWRTPLADGAPDPMMLPEGLFTRTVTVYDAAGNATPVSGDVEVWHPPAPVATRTLNISTASVTEQPNTNPSGNNPPSGGVQGDQASQCRTPRLSVTLRSKPVRVSKGTPVVRYKKSYRFTGRLTCVINGKRQSAPKRTKVSILNKVGKKTVRKPNTAIRSKGAVDLKLAFVSSRTVIFRYTNASGQKSEVKIKVRVTKKKK